MHHEFEDIASGNEKDPLFARQPLGRKSFIMYIGADRVGVSF
jgi:hypothetical protein